MGRTLFKCSYADCMQEHCKVPKRGTLKRISPKGRALYDAICNGIFLLREIASTLFFEHIKKGLKGGLIGYGPYFQVLFHFLTEPGIFCCVFIHLQHLVK